MSSAISLTGRSFLGQPPACTVESQPNPITKQYPRLSAGNFDSTILVTPIPLDIASPCVPKKWFILEHAYHALMPDIPKESYLVYLQSGPDHDVKLESLHIDVPEFSVADPSSPSNNPTQRMSYSFPFIDLLSNNTTSFIWSPAQMISSSGDFAIVGSRAYGTTV